MRKQIYDVYSPSGFHWVGNGFKSNNYDIPQTVIEKLLDPFLMIGFAPPKTFEPTEKQRGVGSHPHAGFETVTLVYDGELAHADSAGNRGVLREGGVQWMTAGRGLMHEEFHSADFSRQGGVLSMSQLWVNLPKALKKIDPAYQDIEPEAIPSVELSGGLRIR
ncbi:MAG: pirin family protein, partial [Rhodothermales bacterium]|nr:pirin family protein [Rhodothermales bacterium]